MTDSIAIYSPSYKRAQGVKTHLLIPGLRYCVHTFEAGGYRDQGHQVEEIPDDQRGNIARVRNWILNLAQGRGERRVLIIDDDIEAVRRWDLDQGQWTQKKMTPVNLDDFIRLGFDLAEEWGVHLWGVNPAGDKGSYHEYTPFSCKSYISGSFSGFIDNPLRYDESLPLKEDYDMTIQQCLHFRKVLRVNSVSLLKRDHQNIGGCADYRTLEREKQQLADLQAKWGTRIVKADSGASQVRKTKEGGHDINPIIKIPIRGV